jgi:Tfp pilus assembly protein PilV
MTPTARHQRGASLLEALIAFLVLSLGLLGMVKLQAHLRLDADLSRQRSEAVRLAQQDIEEMRAFASIAAAPNQRSYAAIASATRDVDAASGYSSNTRYAIARRVIDNPGLATKTASVTVSWADRGGKAHDLALEAMVGGIDPLLSASLALAKREHAVKGSAGRSPLVPRTAKDLGNGRSVLKPTEAGSLAFVFSNSSGQIVARCNAVPTTRTTRDMTASDVADCNAANGMLLAGVVRFSTGTAPDPARGNDSPLPFAITLALSGGPYLAQPQCGSDATRLASGEQFVTYHCMVTPLAAGRWSGRSSIVPQGWTLGAAASQYKVCRYSADQDGSGNVDSNAEHPKDYSEVAGALMQQNFLIIRGDQACPVAPIIAGSVFSNLSTVQHQP